MGPLWHPLQRSHLWLHQHTVRWLVSDFQCVVWGNLLYKLYKLAAQHEHLLAVTFPAALLACCRLVQSKDKGAVIEVEGEQVKLGIPQVCLLAPSGSTLSWLGLGHAALALFCAGS